MENTIHLWDAIREMREATADNRWFTIVFMSCDMGRQISTGIHRVERAKLRPATPKDQNKNADYMLNFMDIQLNQPRQIYQICLMEYNGKKITVT